MVNRSHSNRSNKKLYKLYPSTIQSKKYDIWINNHYTNRIKKISFGAKNYSDYSIHHDRIRRQNYRTRHQHDKINDPTSSGFWSWHLLWGKSIDINKNLKWVLKEYF